MELTSIFPVNMCGCQAFPSISLQPTMYLTRYNKISEVLQKR